MINWGSSGGVIKSIQRGTIMMNGVNTNTATITSVDTSKAVLSLLGWTGPASGDGDYQPRISLTNDTTMTANRTGTNNVTTVAFQVTEYY